MRATKRPAWVPASVPEELPSACPWCVISERREPWPDRTTSRMCPRHYWQLSAEMAATHDNGPHAA